MSISNYAEFELDEECTSDERGWIAWCRYLYIEDGVIYVGEWPYDREGASAGEMIEHVFGWLDDTPLNPEAVRYEVSKALASSMLGLNLHDMIDICVDHKYISPVEGEWAKDNLAVLVVIQ